MPHQRRDRSVPARSTPEDQTYFTGALPLCGDGPLDFTAIELIARDGVSVARRVMMLDQIWTAGDSHHATAISERLDWLTKTRRRIVGLPLDRSLIMGIVNVTPDSFSDGGAFIDAQAAVAHGLALVAAGADLLDIGGESTRPGSGPAPLEVELARVLPVIAGLQAATDVPISIDTRKAAVMEQAVAAGASMINDVSALSYDPESLSVAVELNVPVVLMHALGDPKHMQTDPHYVDVSTDVFDYLEARIAACLDAGLSRDKLIVDPGIGFGKTLAHNLQLLSELALFHGLGCPILLGASRKSFIGRMTGQPQADQRLPGSLAAALTGVAQGVQILRVHDVQETRAALTVWQAATMGTSPALS
jgi:dihydropteroate synthase